MSFNGNVYISGPSIINGATINLTNPTEILTNSLKIQTETNAIEFKTGTVPISYSLTLPNELPVSNSFLKGTSTGLLFWENGNGTVSIGNNYQLGTLDDFSLEFVTGVPSGGPYNIRMVIDNNGLITIPPLSLIDGVLTINETGLVSSVAGTNTNMALTFVKRDSSGDFIANNITSNLTGIASGNINKTGDIMTGQLELQGGISFGNPVSGGIRVETLETAFVQNNDFLIECTNVGIKVLILPDSISDPGRMLIIVNKSNTILTIKSNKHIDIATGNDTINDNIDTEIIINLQFDRITFMNNGQNIWYVV